MEKNHRMKAQSFENHPHFPTKTVVAAVLSLLALVGFAINAFLHPGFESVALIALTLSVMVLVVISRTYTVRLQDRIIRVEMCLRLERLGKSAEFSRLSTPQLVALRFASDAELPGLVDRTLRDNLSLEQIKQAVTDWQPDDLRT